MSYKPKVLELAAGGTNASLTASNGGIFYSTSTAAAVLAGTATAGQVLVSGSSAAPTWSTATYPATATGTGTILRANGTNWVATTATYPTTTTAFQLLASTATNVVGEITVGATGTVLTGVTGAVPAFSATPLVTSLSLNSGSNTILAVKRTITNAEMKALNGTPVTIIAAPASGSANIPINLTVRFNYGGSNAFTDGGSLQLRSSSGTILTNMGSGIYTGTTDNLYGINSGAIGSPFGLLEDLAVVLTTATSNPGGNAANDNTLDITVLYQVITL